jgi:hypothetical protein
MCSAFVFVVCLGWSNPGVTQTTAQTPEDPMAVGKQALQHGKWEDTQKFFDAYLSDNPGNPEAQYLPWFCTFWQEAVCQSGADLFEDDCGESEDVGSAPQPGGSVLG